MLVESKQSPRKVHDFVFTFGSGFFIEYTVDHEAGDRIDFDDPEAVKLYLAAKPSATDPDTILPAEDITIRKVHLAITKHREREVVPMSPDQQLAWKKVLQEMTTKTVQ